MDYAIKSPRKLIEVALPLDSINAAAAREKSIRQGHPSTLHLWWARRPLAAARAVIFAQLVNDPGYQQGGGFKYGVNKKQAAIERQRLFRIMEDLVIWENSNSERVLEAARSEIERSWREVCELNREHPDAHELFDPSNPPGLHDPFAGGGAIPLEAQRLGLKAFASDLNPVAVLLNKSMIEIPTKFAGHEPVANSDNPPQLSIRRNWQRYEGLAEDVRRYGDWIRLEAEKRIGRFYQPIEITTQMAQSQDELKPFIGQKLTVIAWLWARTVKSPSPAFSDVEVPLTSTYILSTKEGKEVFVEPSVDGSNYSFHVKVGTPPPNAKNGTKAGGRGANFRCLVSDAPISGDYIKSEAQHGRLGTRLLAVVLAGSNSRVYLSPTTEMEQIAKSATPTWQPDVEFFKEALGFRVGNYGMSTWSSLFTKRQLLALSTFSDLVTEARIKICQDAEERFEQDSRSLNDGGKGAAAYADAVSVYLAFAVSKIANIGSTIASWMNDRGAFRETFARQALSMTWDFAEANPFADAGGSFNTAIDKGAMVLEALPDGIAGTAVQANASLQDISILKVVSTDPPYYDNIGYADLSDFFYVWLRHCLRPVYPGLFATITVPKDEELVATPARHGGRAGAEKFFLDGMTQAMHRLAEQAHPAFPVTIYYAFKQSESEQVQGTASTGWETFLEGVIRAGFAISGTWPMRTEGSGRMRAMDSNALASSIILVCRKRSVAAKNSSRRDFLRELNAVLPAALDEMTRGCGAERSPVAPVDLSQAIIGPGMAVFSQYKSVLEADGTPMSVRTALQLINRFLAEDDYDHDTQFCLHWFEQYGWTEGKFGDADTLSRAKGTSVEGVKDAGVVRSGGGVVRLLKWSEYSPDWDPKTDARNPVWETLHHLVRALKNEGESSAGKLLAATKSQGEAVRQLAYRLYTLCERQGWAEDARSYNELITSWSAIELTASQQPVDKQLSVFE